MSKELQDKIVAVCPNVVFSMPEWWGFECGDGWFELLRDLFAELNAIPDIGRISITQVKQKYGELRVYTSGEAVPGVDAAIQKAAERALITCEKCGKEGRPVVNERGWHRVTCDGHRKPDDRDLNESDMTPSTLWFGPTWNAPICVPANECVTPNRPCYVCGKEFDLGDRGLVMPFHGGPGDPSSLPAHLECMRVVLGFSTPKTV